MVGVPDLSDSALTTAFLAGCEAFGVDPAGACFLRFSVNSVFRLARTPVVVRVRRAFRDAVDQSVAVARWLEEIDAPVVRLADGPSQPIRIGDFSVTFWVAEDPGNRWQGADLALPLLDLHRRDPAPFLTDLRPLDKVRLQLAAVEYLNAAEYDRLHAECQDLEDSYEKTAPKLLSGTIHGDAKIGNLLRRSCGQVVLGDLDDVGVGPLAYDLVPTVVDAIRWGHPVRKSTFAHAYGYDVTEDPAWPLLRRIREFRLAVTMLAKSDGRPELAAEARRRIHHICIGDESYRWIRPRDL